VDLNLGDFEYQKYKDADDLDSLAIVIYIYLHNVLKIKNHKTWLLWCMHNPPEKQDPELTCLQPTVRIPPFHTLREVEVGGECIHIKFLIT